MQKIKCEIYSRVAGYFRPVNQWNKGKQSEFGDRVNLKIPEVIINEVPGKKIQV